MSRNRRIVKEIKAGIADPNYDFYWEPKTKTAYIKFTVQSGIYKDQVHILQFKFEYGTNTRYRFPDNPPLVTFLTPMFHVNVSLKGSICLDVIKHKWSPLYGISTIFNSVIALLDTPNTASPYNGKASGLYEDLYDKHPDQYIAICNEFYKKRYDPVQFLHLDFAKYCKVKKSN